MALQMDGPFEKYNYPQKTTALALTQVPTPSLKVKSKKMKYRSPVAMCLESRKKRRKKKPVTPVSYQPLAKPSTPPAVPHIPSRKEWLHKHKKRKKKESKEKSVNLEVLKLIDDLADVFNKKCIIEERKPWVLNVIFPPWRWWPLCWFYNLYVIRSKTMYRAKEKSKKKKHSEKVKHSDNDSEYETASPLSVAASVTSSKRRHKKSAIETPKVRDFLEIEILYFHGETYEVYFSFLSIFFANLTLIWNWCWLFFFLDQFFSKMSDILFF